MPGSTLGAKPLKAGCYSACIFRAKAFLELAASDLCKTSYIMALQSQSPACPMDLIPPGSLAFHFTEAHGAGIVCFFSSFSLKKIRECCFCGKALLFVACCWSGTRLTWSLGSVL